MTATGTRPNRGFTAAELMIVVAIFVLMSGAM